MFIVSKEESLLTNRARLSKGVRKGQAVEALCRTFRIIIQKLDYTNKNGPPKGDPLKNGCEPKLHFDVHTEEDEPACVERNRVCVAVTQWRT